MDDSANANASSRNERGRSPDTVEARLTQLPPALSEALGVVDARLVDALSVELRERLAAPRERLPRATTLVLAGHRASGKSSLLPLVAGLVGRPGVDLDALLEARFGRTVREWVEADEASFRSAERALFETLPVGSLVAVGGGFLFHHGARALRRCLTALVPVTLETYLERLSRDSTRPRLKPHLPLLEELHETYLEREEVHRRLPLLSLALFLARAHAGTRPLRVVTAPPQTDVLSYAFQARRAGADLLELRTDLREEPLPLTLVAGELPLLVADRTGRLPADWEAMAALVDRPLGGARAGLVSWHAEGTLTPAQAEARWAEVEPGVLVKHVEPLGDVRLGARLLETQARLEARFGVGQVTVLTTGELALPWRAVLAERNALDYLALDGTWAPARGQRLLADAARETKVRPVRVASPAPFSSSPSTLRTGRLGILGRGLSHSRSPRIHTQPFDRLDLPPSADLGGVLQALHGHYRGFAVTAPFKHAAARVVGSREAVNTLVAKAGGGWAAFNTDVDGARVALQVLGAPRVTLLGDGGATHALKVAAAALGVEVEVYRLKGESSVVSGTAVWTWPPDVEAPDGLFFDEATVAVIAYGPPGAKVAANIRALGGLPVKLGHRWFIAQARAQRRHWDVGG